MAAPKIVRDMSRWAYRATGLTPQVVLREADGVPEWEVSVEYDRTRASACYRQAETGAWQPHAGHMIIDGQEYATASSAHALAVALLSPDEYIGGEVEELLEVEDRPVEEAPSLVRAVYRSASSRLTAEQTDLPGFSLRVGTTSAGWAVLMSFEQAEVIEFRFRKTGSGWRLGTPAWRALRRGQDVTAHVDAALRAALNSLTAEYTQPLSEPARMLRKASPGARSNATATARAAVNRV